MKNSFSNNEYFGFEKSKNPNRLPSEINNTKVEFIVNDNDSSEEENSEENMFNLEIESNKQHQKFSSSISPSLPSSFLNSAYNVPNVKTNQNLSLLTQSIQNKNNKDNSNNKGRNSPIINFNINNKMNHSSKPFFQKMINYHMNNNSDELSSSLKSNKIRFGNQTKNLKLKESPMKYNGLDLLKPILKKRSAYGPEQILTSNSSCPIITINSKHSPIRKKKSVHFKSENEECPFKKLECPKNIVNLPIYVVDSQLEPFLEVKLVKLDGFPTKKKIQLPSDKNVILESIGLIDDDKQEHDIVRLTIQVRNIAFEKKVKVHYTLDNWKHVKIGEARYRSSEIKESNENIDKFIANIDTEGEENISHLQFAIQYIVSQQEFWDNNNGKNYSLRIERTVRIPAKAIKSHPYSEGPIVKYKLKPGYHYPSFKSNINEHPSADIQKPFSLIPHGENKTTRKEEKLNNYEKEEVNEIKQKNNSQTKNHSDISNEKNTLENFLSSDFIISNDISSESMECKKEGIKIKNENENENENENKNDNENEVEKEKEEEEEFGEKEEEEEEEEEVKIEEVEVENDISKNVFSWNEPILLRKPGFDINQSQSNRIESSENSLGFHVNDHSRSRNTSMRRIDVTMNNNSNSNNNNNNLHDIENKFNTTFSSTPVDNKYPLDNAFKLLKHENWFKEAPSCIPFSSPPRKLYHQTNNIKLFQNYSLSKSLFGNRSQNQIISEKEKQEEEENRKKMNSKYSFSTHLPSSSSKYMRNNPYTNYQSIHQFYSQSPSQSPLTYDYEMNFRNNMNINHNNNSYFNPHFNSHTGSTFSIYNTTHPSTNDNQFTQNYMKPILSNASNTRHNIYSTTRLYATQEDFISDNIAYF